MSTVKRLYLYGVLLVSLVLLTWGLADLVGVALDGLGRVAGHAPAIAGTFAREELSRAIALGLVGGLIFGTHVLLVRRTLIGPEADPAVERSCPSRSSYFFLVLTGIGLAGLLSAYEFVQGTLASVAFGLPGYELAWPLGGALVCGGVWAVHLVVRQADLSAAPHRLAGDWLDRAYLYGTLLLTGLAAALQLGEALTVMARELLGAWPGGWSEGLWEEAFASSVAGAIVATGAWSCHWLLAQRRRGAPDPMGAAHRSARTRRGYFLAIVLAAATSVAILVSISLRALLELVTGTWQPADTAAMLETVGGPMLMALPFMALWWWHGRRVSSEARQAASPTGQRSVDRTRRLVVAAVGLAGLTAGLAWQLQLLFDALAADVTPSLIVTGTVPDSSPGAVALAATGLLLWLPAWAASQRERAQHVGEASSATSRRAYLLFVSGAAVIAAMGALAYLIWQGTRVLLDSGTVDDTSWAFAIIIVAATTLGYHLWQLRGDLLVARSLEASDAERPGIEAQPLEARVRETIEISAPSGADFKVLNAAIRTELPEGYELRVLHG